MLYWTQELAPPIQEFQLLVEHYLPSLLHTSSVYRTHCRWLSRPVRSHSALTALDQDQPAPLTHSCYWMSLKRFWFCLLYTFLSDISTHGCDPRTSSSPGWTLPALLLSPCMEHVPAPQSPLWHCTEFIPRNPYLSCTLTWSQPQPEPSTLYVSSVLSIEVGSFPLTCWQCSSSCNLGHHQPSLLQGHTAASWSAERAPEPPSPSSLPASQLVFSSPGAGLFSDIPPAHWGSSGWQHNLLV